MLLEEICEWTQLTMIFLMKKVAIKIHFFERIFFMKPHKILCVSLI
jgi:ABC-type phosphate/phosphonate transport system ATPase subunit